MDLLADLTKGDGCGPQQGAVAGLANQVLRTGMLPQQGGAPTQVGAQSAAWRHGMQQAMQGQPMGAGAANARFQGVSPMMMRQMSMPAPELSIPDQQRSISAPSVGWTQEFHRQQQQLMQQQSRGMEDAWRARAQMTQQQQQQQHAMMMQQQHMQQMMRQQMMMMQPQMGMVNPHMVALHHQQQQQPALGPQQAANQDTASVAEQQTDAPQASQDQESGGASKEAPAVEDPMLQSAAYRRMEEAWASMQKGEGSMDNLWQEMMAMNGLDTAAAQATQQGPRYSFQRENRFAEDARKVAEIFAEGMRLFKDGLINDALLAFEAVAQQEPEHAEAWRMLGQCHADHDEDQKAIVCLEKSAECDAYNLPTLLALGVCYVNELDHERALSNLKAWVEHNPDFIGLEVKDDPYSDGSLVDEVMNLMLQVQDHDPSNADVQEVLGVLYNVSKDYDHAIAAFRKALEGRPNDYALWNKLGATQANSNRSEEAMPAYHRALELKPRYARGLLNLGISHSNIGSFEEATRHYLSALALNPKGHHIWSFIRNSARALGRMDLVHKANMRDLAAFQAEFDIPFLEQQGPPVDPVV